MKKFDLNIEKVLEAWEVSHALREVIANAIDEKTLTQTAEIRIFQDENGVWHIKDFGRGLKYEHLTQNENQEKLQHPESVIGKFGVGLKDALATFDRKNIGVLIRSKYGEITIEKATKHDFEDLTTLHAVIKDPIAENFVGTEFLFTGITAQDILLAKNYFLLFANEQVLEKTQYGEVLQGKENTSRFIYINGVKVAEEKDFLFSYNITSLTQTMRKALNRERTHVGRTAYTERVKSILLNCRSGSLASLLVNDLQEFGTGKCHDELRWTDIAAHASLILNSQEKVIFMSSEELINNKTVADRAERDGYHIVTVPTNVLAKISGQTDLIGKKVTDVRQFNENWAKSFEFKYVNPQDLSPNEQRVFNSTDKILQLIGGQPRNVAAIRISETMRPSSCGNVNPIGLWQAPNIIIKRSGLGNISSYAGTLLHEVAHATSGAGDSTHQFEDQLTYYLGRVAAKALEHDNLVSIASAGSQKRSHDEANSDDANDEIQILNTSARPTNRTVSGSNVQQVAKVIKLDSGFIAEDTSDDMLPKARPSG